ncbi:MAG: methyltransferase domain-containing protein [Patescibacteria group bacterium]|jgi:SAM-dependent methyltransferase|nr:methyltransferase domain-containing protein [Patescibacteria group bacterium]
MQTPGEKYLIKYLIKSIKRLGTKAYIINIGANTSLVIEKELDGADCDFIEDRTDVIDSRVEYLKLNKTYICSVEEMREVSNDSYDIVFANFVLEHVDDLNNSAKEINRILKNEGSFVTSIPNPQAPEFLISKFTPLWFHQYIRGEGEGEGHEAHETKYSYKSIKEFVEIFESKGLKLVEKNFTPFTFGYLYRFPIIGFISKIYDKIIHRLGYERLMGNVCLAFEKK